MSGAIICRECADSARIPEATRRSKCLKMPFYAVGLEIIEVILDYRKLADYGWNMNLISKKEAISKGMSPLTHPELPDSDFFKSVLRDMQQVKGTVWGVVEVGKGKMCIWRKRLAIPKNYESGTIRN